VQLERYYAALEGPEMEASGIFTSSYDASPSTQELTDGLYMVPKA